MLFYRFDYHYRYATPPGTNYWKRTDSYSLPKFPVRINYMMPKTWPALGVVEEMCLALGRPVIYPASVAKACRSYKHQLEHIKENFSGLWADAGEKQLNLESTMYTAVELFILFHSDRKLWSKVSAQLHQVAASTPVVVACDTTH